MILPNMSGQESCRGRWTTLHLFMAGLCLLTSVLPTNGACRSHEHDLGSGKCCRKCTPGFGVSLLCTLENDTECVPCVHGQTFSTFHSHEELCQTCIVCQEHAHIKIPCNITHDTQCECDRDHYLESVTKYCRPCDLCPHGFGASQPCSSKVNTICRKCPNGTYSDVLSSTLGCIVCSVCRIDQLMLQECNSIQDTICIAKDIGLNSKSSRKSSGSDMVNYVGDHTSQNIIPVYCAILGAVVLGLVGYVVMKHWRIHTNPKVNLQKGITMPLAQTELVAPHCHSSDSGVFLDKDKDLIMSPNTRIRELPLAKYRELEKLLNIRRLDQRNWIGLAKELGYNNTRIASFDKHSDKLNPARRLLLEWSKTEHATIESLVRALRKIGRMDAIRILQESSENRRFSCGSPSEEVV